MIQGFKGKAFFKGKGLWKAIAITAFSSIFSPSLYAYTQASSTDELLKLIDGKGVAFLRNMPQEQEPPLCHDSVQSGLSVAGGIFSVVPGGGSVGNILNLANASIMASVCRGNDGLAFTWDEVMDAIDQKIDLALSDEKRQQMRDIYGYFHLELASKKDLLSKFEKGELTDADIMKLSTELTSMLSDLELSERVLDAGAQWQQITFLPQLALLKYNINLVLAELYLNHSGLQATAQDYLNLQMEKSRIKTLQTLKKAYEDYNHMVSSSNTASIYYKYEEGRTGPFATWEREYKIAFWDANGLNHFSGNKRVYESHCNGALCNGITANTWHDRRKRKIDEAKILYRDLMKDLHESKVGIYRDFVEKSNYFKGAQFFLISNFKGVTGGGYRASCLRPSISTGHVSGLEVARCSIDFSSLGSVPLEGREGRIDTWRIHDKTGLLINESTGLCLDLADGGVQLTLSACEYDLDPQREEKTTQEWSILDNGLIVNRNTQQCLNASDADSMAQMKDCNTLGYKTIYSDGIGYEKDMAQNWYTRFIQCDLSENCQVIHELAFNEPTSFVHNKARHVFAADQLVGNAKLNADIAGYTDTGFIDLDSGSGVARWENQQVISGKYRLTLYMQGHPNNTQGEQRLWFYANDKRIESVASLPWIAPGEKAVVEFDIALPEFTHTLALVRKSKHYLIDKWSLTPIVED